MSEVVSQNSAESLVANLIHEVNGISPQDINLDDSLTNDLTMDSVEIIDLLMRLEEIVVTIPESMIGNLTVRDIVQRVKM